MPSKMTTKDFLNDLDNTFKTCLDIAKKKNADYADTDNPFKNFEMSSIVGIDPAHAILVRISEKLARIGGLLDRAAVVEEEKIEDTLIDLINYCAILKAYLKK
jgi:hypothetical protein